LIAPPLISRSFTWQRLEILEGNFAQVVLTKIKTDLDPANFFKLQW